jgi:DNA-binding transcriptional LysR family regulator
MNLHELQTLVSIAQLGGLTRAAGQLHRSQPAITRRIKLLEDQLGVPLLERGRGGTVLTEAGRTFLPYAEAILAALKDGAQAVQALQGEDHGAVSLAMVGTLAGTTIVQQLRRFSARHRNVRIELRTANSFEVSDMVRRGEVSLGLRYFGDPSPELISQQISEERIVLVCSAQHKWSGKRLRDPERLRTDQWLALPMTRHRDSFAHLVARQLASVQLDDVPVMAIDSLTAQKRLIEAGIGIALLPESSIQEELRLGTLRTIDIPRLQTTVPIHVLYRKNGYLTGASRTLLSLISAAPVRPTATAHQNRKRKLSPRRRSST